MDLVVETLDCLREQHIINTSVILLHLDAKIVGLFCWIMSSRSLITVVKCISLEPITSRGSLQMDPYIIQDGERRAQTSLAIDAPPSTIRPALLRASELPVCTHHCAGCQFFRIPPKSSQRVPPPFRPQHPTRLLLTATANSSLEGSNRFPTTLETGIQHHTKWLTVVVHVVAALAPEATVVVTAVDAAVAVADAEARTAARRSGSPSPSSAVS